MNEFKKLFSLALEELGIATLILDNWVITMQTLLAHYSEAEILLEKAKAFVTEVERILNEQ